MEKFRSRNFCLLLYPEEDISHKKALDYIKLNYDYALITHTNDKTEEGSLKKAHTHVVISLPNGKWNTALASDIGIEYNYIQRCRSLNNALEYLIHYNDDSKYQYSINDVQGSLKSKLIRILQNDKKDENEKAFQLIDYIYNKREYISMVEFCQYCCEIGMWDVFRRAGAIYIRLLDEHNSRFMIKTGYHSK